MRPSAPLALLAAYFFCRAVLGASLNPLHNGPDEGGHVEYVAAIAAGRPATGVETRQLPTYYALASVPWRLTEGAAPEARSFAVRLLSGAAGVATLIATWLAARSARPWDEVSAPLSTLWLLAPGHMYVLSSVSNDPLVSALAALSCLAALRVWVAPGTRVWWAIWAVLSAVALLVKPTALPVVFGAVAAFAWRWRRPLLSRPAARPVLAALAALAVAANVSLALGSPTLSAAHSLARYWPLMLFRAPIAYLERGGIVESFRTWWYGYDYLVRWPGALEFLLAVTCLSALGLAVAGLAMAGHRAVPGIVWACALAQIAFVLGRYGFADVLRINMGGAAQAKAFFPAIAPLAVLGGVGLAEVARRVRIPPRALALGLFATLLAVDAVSVAVTTWRHYRWWQVGA